MGLLLIHSGFGSSPVVTVTVVTVTVVHVTKMPRSSRGGNAALRLRVRRRVP